MALNAQGRHNNKFYIDKNYYIFHAGLAQPGNAAVRKKLSMSISIW